MRRYAKKLDGTHTEIKQYLEANGCEVIDCSAAGKVPDLLVRYKPNGNTGWVEVKIPTKGEVRFTLAQLAWMANTTYAVRIVDNKEDALEFAKTHEGALTQQQKDRLAYFCSRADKKLYTPNQVSGAINAN